MKNKVALLWRITGFFFSFIVWFMMNKAAENDEEVSDIVTKRERIKQSIKLLFMWLRLYTKGSI